MFRHFLIGFFGVFMLAAGTASAQQPRIAGLASNEEYMSVLHKQQVLKNAEDSIQRVIQKIRVLFQQDTLNRAKYRKDILLLENKLFEIQGDVAITASRANLLEQEYILNRLTPQSTDTMPAPAQPQLQSPAFKEFRNLCDNTFFQHNLIPKDYQALRSASQTELQIPALIEQFVTNYGNMKTIHNQYDTVKTAVLADSLFAVLNHYAMIQKQLEDSLNHWWLNSYETKSYLYSYLLDKINRTDLLDRLGAEEKESRIAESGTDGNQLASPVFAAYPIQKRLITKFELTLAETLNLNLAKDSLRQVTQNFRNGDSLKLQKILVQPKDFTPYASITIEVYSPYSGRNPIPKHTAPTYFTIYKIQLGTYSKKQSISSFRGVVPLSFEILEDNRYRYYAGTYKTRVAAEADLPKLKDEGFYDPELVMWENGAYRNLTNPLNTGVNTTSKNTSTHFFRVEIKGQEELSDELKAFVDRYAPQKEISRVATSEGMTYLVGQFEDQETAATFVELLSQGFDNIQVRFFSI